MKTPVLLGVLAAIGAGARDARAQPAEPEPAESEPADPKPAEPAEAERAEPAEPAEPPLEEGFASAEQVFAAKPPRSLADHEVYFEDVPVRRKSGRGLWIGYSARRQVFVLPVDPSFVSFVAVGAKVDVRGTLRESPAAAQAARDFALDRASARRLANAPLYIDAWSISYM
ncbi:MAG TPA: hypothetical protein VK932_27140 [Kofleriaceae bacterium]|nr:hypothetical protein [Kofleriaceae bacterium]